MTILKTPKKSKRFDKKCETDAIDILSMTQWLAKQFGVLSLDLKQLGYAIGIKLGFWWILQICYALLSANDIVNSIQ